MTCELINGPVVDGVLRHVGDVGSVLLDDPPNMARLGASLAHDTRATVPFEVARPAWNEADCRTNWIEAWMGCVVLASERPPCLSKSALNRRIQFVARLIASRGEQKVVKTAHSAIQRIKLAEEAVALFGRSRPEDCRKPTAEARKNV